MRPFNALRMRNPAGAAIAATSFSPKYKRPNVTLSNSNLTLTTTATGYNSACSIDAKTSGRWYFEATVGATFNSGTMEIAVGVVDHTHPMDTYAGQGTNSGQISSTNVSSGGNVSSLPFATPVAGDIISVDYDIDADTIRFRKNGGTWSSTYFVTNTQPMMPFAYISGNTCSLTLNFGATAFAYTPPSGATGWTTNAVKAWRYFRYTVQSSNASNSISVAEFEGAQTAGGADFFTGGTASASSIHSAPYSADKAVDDNNSTIWHCASGAAVNAYWQYDLGSGNAKTFAEIRHRLWADILLYSPNFKYVVSDDGSTFFPLYGVTDTTWTLGEVRTLTFP